MRLIKNKYIPFKGFKAIMLFGLVFYKGGYPSKITQNHEYWHKEQYKEVTVALAVPIIFLAVMFSWWLLVFIPLAYYFIYLIEWAIKSIIYKDMDLGYENISFEREAYDIQHINPEDCVKSRPNFSWVKYILKK